MVASLTVNDKYELIIKTKQNNQYNAKFIYEMVQNPFAIPKNIKIIKRTESQITFEFEQTNITFYIFSTDCFLEDEKINTIIYSLEHLKLIILKLNYDDPILFLVSENKIISLKQANLEDLEIYLEKNIIIKNNYMSDGKMKNKFSEQKKLLEEYDNNKLKHIFNYKMISYNIKNYLKSIKDEALKEPFYYIISKERYALEKSIINFLKNKKESIYPVVGPYGIGKSMTALIIQKNLAIKGIKSLYVNLKYYYQTIPFINKLETLMDECFYLCSSEENFLSYRKLFENKNYNDIWPYLKDIYDNLTDYTNVLFILDQYKKSYDQHDNIFLFKKIHIFLLSSINDKDVKSNIEKLLKKEDPKLKYHYLSHLIVNNIEIFLINNEKLLKKVTKEENYLNNSNNNDDMNNDISTFNSINENDINTSDYNNKNNNINNNINKIKENEEEIDTDSHSKNKTLNNILTSFGYLPRYISLLLNKYDNIFDLANEEYIKIFKGFRAFYEQNNISNFKNLTINFIFAKNNNNYMNMSTFICNLKDICLKYVNYEENNKNFYLKYAFPLCENIFNTFYKYDSDRTKFINDKETGFTVFENFLKITLRCFGKLQIDGYFEVKTIVDLKLTDYYECLNNSYFLNKCNILINQKNTNGKDFDFCIYKPDKKIIILIQVKYRITNDNVQSYYYYQKNYSDFHKKFKKTFKVPIEKVYLLYFSSYYYNQNNRHKVLDILNRRKINCLFFNVMNTEISFDFENNIDSIPLSDSFILFPNQQKYTSQWEEKEKTTNIYISTFLNKKRFIEKKIKNYRENKNKKNNSIEEIYYNKFFEYFSKNRLISNSIFQCLGEFINIYINSFGQSENIPYEDLYLFVFEHSIKGIDFSGKLGLIYIDNLNKIIFLDIKNNKEMNENMFCEQFDGCWYAIGKYKRNSL